MTPEEIRRTALALPETVEGSSCVNRAFTAGRKNFLFLGEKDDSWNVRLKLKDSLPAAEALGYDGGKIGWIKMEFAPGETAPAETAAWIRESYRLIVPKRLSKQLT